MRRWNFLLFLMIFSRTALSEEVSFISKSLEPPKDRGLYTLGLDEEIAQMPYITGGRIILQWADLEKGKKQYDFSKLDAELQAYKKRGMKATVQVNGLRKPRWLFGEVAVLPVEHVQIADPEGALQYWDPVFTDAYLNFIQAYGDHLKRSDCKDIVLGIRQNFNAVGTEHSNVKGLGEDIRNWKPAPNGNIHPEPYSKSIYADYARKVIDAHIEAFLPEVRVFVRNNVVADRATESQLALIDSGKLGLFHTSTEHQPRGGDSKYRAFLKYCRTGKTLGYAEPYCPSKDGATGGIREYKRNSSKVTPAQYNYWRLLLDLHCGISFIAAKPDDLRMGNNPEYGEAFRFASRYAGYHASPEVSPGAWVALREGDTLKGDYHFLMERIEEKSTDSAFYDQGPPEQRFGGWARGIDDGERIVFRLHPLFRESLENASIRIVYLDEGTNRFEISWPKGETIQRTTIEKNDSKKWKETVIEVPDADFTGSLEGGDVQLTGPGRNVFHMVEVIRSEVRG